jgi:hypothetical protein
MLNFLQLSFTNFPLNLEFLFQNFTHLNYDRSKISYCSSIKSMKVVAAAVYKSTTVNYDRKSFIKSAPVETVR